MHKHFRLAGKSEKVQSYSSVAPSLGDVIDGSFIANVKNLYSFLPVLARHCFGLTQHVLVH